MSLLRWYCSKRKPPSEKAKQRWQKTRARGKKSYVLRVGVLRMGGLMFVAMTAQDLISTPRFQHQSLYYVLEIALNLLIWPVAGYFWGKIMWDVFEMYFAQESRQTPTS